MATKIRPFSTKIAHDSACTNARAAEFAPNGVFGDSRINGAIQIFLGPTLVTMVTKIGLFSHKIGRNSVCTNVKAAEFAPNRGFSGTAELMVPFNFPLADPCYHGNKNWAIFAQNGP